MTRDEVLEEIARRGEQESAEWKAMKEPGYAMAVTAFVRVIRSLKSKLPEKSPELEAPKDTGTAFGEIYKALDTVKAALAAGRAAEDRLLERRREVEALRRELPQYDCRRTGGPVSDSGGKHCPQEAPCLTCRLERAERDRDFATAASERILRDLETTKAEVARLKWEASDAPMLGEHSGHPSTCPACKDGYPPPPGEPALR